MWLLLAAQQENELGGHKHFINAWSPSTKPTGVLDIASSASPAF